MFEGSVARHLEAIRDLLFYPIFPESGEIIYKPTKNYHALSISVITRVMLESASILYWIIESVEEHVSGKISGYFKYIQLCDAIFLQESKKSLTKEQAKLIQNNKHYLNSAEIPWKNLTRDHVRQDYYLIIEKELGIKQKPKDQLNLRKLATNFLEHDMKKGSFDELHFQKMYGFLSDFVHAHPFAIDNMFSLEARGEKVTINFHNDHPSVLLVSLSTAVDCYRYALCSLLSVFKKEEELLRVKEICSKFISAAKKINNSGNR